MHRLKSEYVTNLIHCDQRKCFAAGVSVLLPNVVWDVIVVERVENHLHGMYDGIILGENTFDFCPLIQTIAVVSDVMLMLSQIITPPDQPLLT